MKRSWLGNVDHPEIAKTLHALGHVNREARDFNQARQHLEEPLRMKCSLDLESFDNAAALHALGQVSRDEGDLKNAKHHFQQ
eukprot:Skav215821  [mRNA]  locus=scaffold3449:215862:216107:- [translate_table: standard]